ncbi:MAG: CoB--CoM heterodisulfide reductase iron-sulfur subunit A family protein [Deltaproteobacteria bacterium]|nr:CoB--CoM heterodisulfide reductase iron-sulfur subunit A family protein [Deltaproteobacteria bacterium]
MVSLSQKPRYIDLDKCTGCGDCAEKCPKRVVDEFNHGLSKRKAVYLPYPQAVPLNYAIDDETCIYFEKGRCRACEKFCQSGAISFDQKEETINLEVGAVILSPGFETFDPRVFNSYSYSTHPNVITAMELERLLSAGGPTTGHLKRPGDDMEPASLAFLQCVGSRDLNQSDHGYCSSVCCMYALKEAIIAKEHSGGELDITIFFMDMRTVGKDFERYYEKAKNVGIRFVRSRVHSVIPNESNGNLALRYAAEDGQIVEEEFELVTLSHGLQISNEVNDLANSLQVDLDKYRFTEASSFTPVSTSRPGIYACGVMTGPKDIPQSVMEASAAAGAVSAQLAGARNTEVREKEIHAARDVSGEPPRIGVFVCDCGVNIAGVVDVPAVAEYARTLPFVEYVEENLFTCAQDTQDRMAEIIQEKNLNRIVVGACSPRTHEALFQETLVNASLNKYLFEMANIRNHDSWVHADEPEAATQKAKDLVRMTVAKAALLEQLFETEIDVTPSALIVGGGIAGLTAALTLSQQGFQVDLVEKNDELGGIAHKIFHTAKGEDVRAFLAEYIDRVMADENINVHLGAKVSELDGFVGNFNTKLSNGAEISHGVSIITTGAGEYEPDEYLAGQDPRVLNSLDMDALLIKDDKSLKEAKAVVFIQCVGSRDSDRLYCSKVCCTHSIINALEIKKRNPEARIFILYRDIRTYGEREDLYREAREKGIIFIRYGLDSKPQVSLDGPDLAVNLTDPIINKDVVIKPDYLVLASAIVSHRDNELAQTFKIPLDQDGWLLEAHQKLRPVDFATDGIFMAGLAHYPKPIEEAIAQAQAAASRAATILSSSSLMVGGTVAEINPARCTGCGVCVEVCPYNAIALDEDEKAAVNNALCKGCGTCATACRSGAPSLMGFTNASIFAQISASM